MREDSGGKADMGKERGKTRQHQHDRKKAQVRARHAGG